MVERNKCMNVPELRFKGFKKEWDFCSVGDFYYFKNGLNKGKEFFGFGTPIVNFTDVFNNRGLTSDILKGRVSLSKKEISSFEVKKGDIFFTRTSETLEEIGYPSVMLDESNDTVFSGFVLRGRAINEDPLSDLFKKYVFFTNDFRKEMIRKSSMTTRALTSGTSIKKMEFYFPENKMEQEKIGIFHSIIDKEIIFITTRIKLLKQIKTASLQSMFPQEGETVPKVRFKGFKEGWKKEKLGNLFKERIENNINGELLSVTINNGIIKASDNGRFDNSNNDKSHYKVVKIGDIVYNTMRMWQGASGYSAYEGIVSPAYTVIIPQEQVFPLFFAYLFKTQSLINRFRIHSQGLTTDTWNLKFAGFSIIEVCFPKSKLEQQKIASYFCNLDRQISLQTQRLEKLKQIKAACLDKMFV
jgi:type I restriction enzyme S subunit